MLFEKVIVDSRRNSYVLLRTRLLTAFTCSMVIMRKWSEDIMGKGFAIAIRETMKDSHVIIRFGSGTAAAPRL